MPSPPSLDPAKLRSRIRRLDREQHLIVIDRAIELLGPDQLAELIRDMLSLDDLWMDRAPPNLVEQVREFCSASIQGEYYDFATDRSISHSRGTASFIAECHRLLRLLGRASEAGQVRDARVGLERLFELLREIDRFEHDIVHFADEAGAWQIGVDWREVLPAWFRCLAAEESPDEFAADVVAKIEEFAAMDRELLIQHAMTVASTEQADALARVR